MTSQRSPEERLGDATLDDAWRAASTEQPAPQSDAAILAAARAETRSGAGASPRRRRASWQALWQPLAAAAGVAGLAFLLVQRLPTETASPEAAPTAVPRQAAESVLRETAEPASDLEAPAAAPTAPPPRTAEPVPQETAERAGALAAPVAAPAAAPPQTAEPVPQGTAERARELAAPAAVPAPAPAARDAVGLAAAKSEADATGPEVWVDRIVKLHASGELAAAADELRAFRGAFADADARLPADLREWASTVEADDAR